MPTSLVFHVTAMEAKKEMGLKIENKQTISSFPQIETESGEFTTGLNNFLNIKRPKSSHKQFQVNSKALWKLMREVQTLTVHLYCFQPQRLVRYFHLQNKSVCM